MSKTTSRGRNAQSTEPMEGDVRVPEGRRRDAGSCRTRK